MFNDDNIRSALTKMYDYSPVDGFIEISQGLGDMMKSLSNEPSVGLFYIQQHTQKSVPNIVNYRNNIVSKSREIGLHTEDSEDSIVMVRSMADCGFPIVDDMIKDIRKSLAIISSKQPRKGLIGGRSGSGSKLGRTSSWGRAGWSSVNVVEKSTTLLSSLGEELPVSSGVSIGDDEEGVLVDGLVSNVSGFEDFDEFKVGKESRFEEWVQGKDTRNGGAK